MSATAGSDGQSVMLGVYVDVPVDWTEIGELVSDAYRAIAPARLLRQLDAEPTTAD